MKAGLCRKLAWGNIGKNYRFFIPRILAETGLLACFYIIFTLSLDDRLSKVKGGSYLPTFMWMGAVIIGLLSLVLILYTNSFLMKQRKREFGLYSVLGLEKKHICRVLFYESFFCALLSVLAGLLFGMLFYKLSSLLICRLLHAEIVAGFYFITPATVLPAGLIFLGIDFFAFLINCVSIGRMKPVELLSGGSTGEKEPKVKGLLLVLGILALGGGYFISLTSKNPLQALLLFFAAVLLVIVGTYFLFISGSIFVLKLLKKTDRFYYRPGKITAVSGLLYRMKQNAVGLASVAILATGVLVMSSTTFCLYSRTESVLETNYPEDFYFSAEGYDESGVPIPLTEEQLTGIVERSADKAALSVKEITYEEYFDVTYSYRDGALLADRPSIAVETDLSALCYVTFITEDTYRRSGGEALGLTGNEIALCARSMTANIDERELRIQDTLYSIVRTIPTFPVNSAMISLNCYGIVVADDNAFRSIFEAQRDAYGDNASAIQSRVCVSFTDRKKTLEAGQTFTDAVYAELRDMFTPEDGLGGGYATNCDSFWEARGNLYGMYGTLLFLGVLLGLVCLFATVLIIYYKQISEGYEDQNRYRIMRKIGMTDGEVKKTIRVQIMLVFFLPLLTAGVHVAFAFPILTRLMKIMLLDNPWLFAKWCILAFAAFALVYALIYKLTARSYYKIVNGR